MRAVADLFTAEAGSFQETMMDILGSVGFRIPIYQRPYDWDEQHLLRLAQDCLNGFHRTVASREDEYTFLGTIILARDESQEPSFEGTSFSVVDGQQRLTSLALMAAVIFQGITENQSDMDTLSSSAQQWLRAEIAYQLGILYQCVMGPRPTFGPDGQPFPRIVRTTDTRGNTMRNSEYRSVVAQLFMKFHRYAQENGAAFDVAPQQPTNAEEYLYSNFTYLKGTIAHYLYQGKAEGATNDHDADIDVVRMEQFRSSGFRELLDRLDILDQSARDRAIDEIAANATSAGLIRLIGFASYFAKSVILTKVVARTERNAFDIFDALNTTGEPLTALETLKPLVVEFEESRARYSGSESEAHWDIIDQTVTNAYESAEERQRASRELLVSFALFYNGHRLSNSLAAQRSYLRNLMRGFPLSRPEATREFIGLIASLADYRSRFWELGEIVQAEPDNFGTEDPELAKLCLTLIKEMHRTRPSLTLPILARYWIARLAGRHPDEFAGVVKAITAFLVIRRSCTGGTANIDGVFRALMQRQLGYGGDPLSVVSDRSTNTLVEIDALKDELCDLLESGVGVTDRDSFSSRAASVEQLHFSRPLTRFLHFAASHNARPDEQHPGLLTREGVHPSVELEVLNIKSWQSGRYATVEHVAPVSEPSGQWDRGIYDDVILNSLGNTVLLPQMPNSLIGNAAWEKKIIFYTALMAKTKSEREELVRSAEAVGLRFTRRIIDLMDTEERLPILDPMEGVSEWTADLVRMRTKNILDLAWDQIAPWLYEDA